MDRHEPVTRRDGDGQVERRRPDPGSSVLDVVTGRWNEEDLTVPRPEGGSDRVSSASAGSGRGQDWAMVIRRRQRSAPPHRATEDVVSRYPKRSSGVDGGAPRLDELVGTLGALVGHYLEHVVSALDGLGRLACCD